MDVLSILVMLIIMGTLFWAVRALSATFGIPQPVVTVINVILVVLVLLYLLQALRGGNGGLNLRLSQIPQPTNATALIATPPVTAVMLQPDDPRAAGLGLVK